MTAKRRPAAPDRREPQLPGRRPAAAPSALTGAEPALPMPPEVLSAAADLRRRDARVRLAAIRRLGELGPAAAPAAGELIRRLRRPQDRRAAETALAAIGAGAVPALIEALRHRDFDVRGRAAETLGRMGAAALPAVPALLDAYRWNHGVEPALRSIGDAARPALRDALRSDDRIVRSAAAGTLALLGDREGLSAALPELAETLRGPLSDGVIAAWVVIGAEAVPALTAMLTDRDKNIRLRAVGTLGSIGPSAAPAVAALCRLLASDRFERVREASASALGRIGGSEAAAALRTALADPMESIQVAALLGLAECGAVDTDVIAGLILNIDRGASGYRYQDLDAHGLGAYAQALVRVGGAHPAAVQAVAGLIPSRAKAGPRQAAVRVLGHIGPPAAPVIHVLEQALADRDGLVRVLAAWALWRIDGRIESGPLLAALGDYSSHAAGDMACETVARLGPAAVRFVPALGERAARCRRPWGAVSALRGIGPPEAAAAVPGLETAAGCSDQWTAAAAVLTIWQLTADPSRVLPLAGALLKRKRLRLWAIEQDLAAVVEQIGREAAPLAAPLAKAIASDPILGLGAGPDLIRSLGAIGPAAAEAVPLLTELADHSSDAVRFAAAEALERIRPE